MHRKKREKAQVASRRLWKFLINKLKARSRELGRGGVAKLAKQTGLTPPQVSRIINGKRGRTDPLLQTSIQIFFGLELNLTETIFSLDPKLLGDYKKCEKLLEHPLFKLLMTLDKEEYDLILSVVNTIFLSRNKGITKTDPTISI